LHMVGARDSAGEAIRLGQELVGVAAEDARLGAAVVQVLLDHEDVKSGAPRPPLPQFPLAYLRRYKHGFDAVHEIGSGGFSTVCV
jgi:hypothetical protein